MTEFIDKQSLGSARNFDQNGYLSIQNNPLTRTGVFYYTRRELGMDGNQDERVGVLRHPDDVADKKSLDSLKRKPVIILHTMATGGDTAVVDGEPLEKIGAQGTTGDNITFDADAGIVLGDLTIWTNTAQTAVDRLKISEISLGYTGDIDFENGVYDGKKYVARQRNIVYNHVALVPEGRMGSAVKVLDAAPNKESKMDEDKVKDESVGQEGGSEMSLSEAVKTITEAVKPLSELIPLLTKLAGGQAAEPEQETEIKEEDMGMDEDIKAMDMDMNMDEMKPAMADGMPIRDSMGRQVHIPKNMSVKDAKTAKKLFVKSTKNHLDTKAILKAAEEAATKKAQSIVDEAKANVDEAIRAKELADRCSGLIGYFDSKGMTTRQVATNVVEKIKGVKMNGDEAIGYLSAILDGANETTDTQNISKTNGKSVDLVAELKGA